MEIKSASKIAATAKSQRKRPAQQEMGRVCSRRRPSAKLEAMSIKREVDQIGRLREMGQ
jgi:hypothetical protein